jgi:hypothetical protein
MKRLSILLILALMGQSVFGLTLTEWDAFLAEFKLAQAAAKDEASLKIYQTKTAELKKNVAEINDAATLCNAYDQLMPTKWTGTEATIPLDQRIVNVGIRKAELTAFVDGIEAKVSDDLVSSHFAGRMLKGAFDGVKSGYNKVVSGVKATGNGIVYGASAVKSGVVNGAKAGYNGAISGAKAVGNGVATGASAVKYSVCHPIEAGKATAHYVNNHRAATAVTLATVGVAGDVAVRGKGALASRALAYAQEHVTRENFKAGYDNAYDLAKTKLVDLGDSKLGWTFAMGVNAAKEHPYKAAGIATGAAGASVGATLAAYKAARKTAEMVTAYRAAKAKAAADKAAAAVLASFVKPEGQADRGIDMSSVSAK